MSKLLDHLKGLRRCAMAHGMPLLDKDGVLEEVKRRRAGITRAEAQQIALKTLTDAEAERLRTADEEAKHGPDY